MPPRPSSATTRAVFKNILPKQVLEEVRRDIFGVAPQKNVREGHKLLKKTFTGPYQVRYYPEKIDSSARKAFPGYTSEIKQRRLDKLVAMKRKGRGPPSKGSGKRASKK